VYDEVDLQTLGPFGYENLEKEIELVQMMNLGHVEKIKNIFKWR